MIAEEPSFWTQFALSDVAGVTLAGLVGYFAHVWQSSRHEVTETAKRYIDLTLARTNIPYTKICDQLEALRTAGVHLFTAQSQFRRFFAYLDARRIDHPWKSDDLFRQIDPLAFFLYTNHHASRFDNPEWVYEVVKDFMLGTKKEPKNDMAKPSPKDEDT